MTQSLSRRHETVITFYRARKLLGVSHYQVLAAVARGDLELVTVQGEPRVTRASVDRLRAKQKETP